MIRPPYCGADWKLVLSPGQRAYKNYQNLAPMKGIRQMYIYRTEDRQTLTQFSKEGVFIYALRSRDVKR